METPIVLRGDKDIAQGLGRIWGFAVSVQSVRRWRQQQRDPLPHSKLRPAGGLRAIIVADLERLRAWARGRLEQAA